MWLYHRVMSPNDADGMVNSVDSDQEQSDLGLHCLPRHTCPKPLDRYSMKCVGSLLCVIIDEWGGRGSSETVYFLVLM